ncbi:hypothetical protein FHX08_004914 [Rhizobium sp. BK529]|nr:hypothetical protein [Rhizobium sp. BK529]
MPNEWAEISNDKSGYRKLGLARAHTIVLKEGLNLAKAAQDLDRKRSRLFVYELRKVITAAIVEAHAASLSSDACCAESGFAGFP